MDKIKIKYEKVKGTVKDLLRPPSRQSALTTPARLHHSSQEPESTRGYVISAASSVTVSASQAVIGPTANVTLSADIPALETEPSLRPAHAPTYATSSAQRDMRKHGEERQVVKAKELNAKSERAITAG